MSLPEKRNGGSPGPGTTAVRIAATTRKPDQPQTTRAAHRDVLVAVGEYHPPAGRRTIGVVIVRRCPACGHLHLHRAGAVATADGSTRVGSCGAEYVLRVLPAQRIGGAA